MNKICFVFILMIFSLSSSIALNAESIKSSERKSELFKFGTCAQRWLDMTESEKSKFILFMELTGKRDLSIGSKTESCNLSHHKRTTLKKIIGRIYARPGNKNLNMQYVLFLAYKVYEVKHEKRNLFASKKPKEIQKRM